MAVTKVPLLMKLMAASVKIAHKAQSVVRDILTTGKLDIVDKGINDLQTKADRVGEMVIVGSLRRQFPRIFVQGEENVEQSLLDSASPSLIETLLDPDILSVQCPDDFQKVTEDQIVVWVDPLDGTSEFIQGLLDHVTILIGISVDGEAVAGVIAQPFYNYQRNSDESIGRVMWAMKGLGIHGLVTSSEMKTGNVVVTTRSHSTNLVDDVVTACEPSEVLRVGGCGNKVLMVLEGKAHVYVFASKGCKKWDTCAPEAFIRSIGGQLTDLHGYNYRYTKDVSHGNTGGVLATLHNHYWYLKKIPQNVLDALPTQV